MVDVWNTAGCIYFKVPCTTSPISILVLFSLHQTHSIVVQAKSIFWLNDPSLNNYTGSAQIVLWSEFWAISLWFITFLAMIKVLVLLELWVLASRTFCIFILLVRTNRTSLNDHHVSKNASWVKCLIIDSKLLFDAFDIAPLMTNVQFEAFKTVVWIKLRLAKFEVTCQTFFLHEGTGEAVCFKIRARNVSYFTS